MIDYKSLFHKINRYIDDNTKKVAFWCTAASIVASLFFLYYLGRIDSLIGAVYVIPAFVYHGIMKSNHKTRKK